MARGGLCAICDGDNQTTRICEECRADPANKGWNRKDFLLGTAADLAESVPAHDHVWADLIDTPIVDKAQRDCRILFYLCNPVTITYIYIDKRGRKRGPRTRKHWLTHSQVALKVTEEGYDCPRSRVWYVAKINGINDN